MAHVPMWHLESCSLLGYGTPGHEGLDGGRSSTAGVGFPAGKKHPPPTSPDPREPPCGVRAGVTWQRHAMKSTYPVAAWETGRRVISSNISYHHFARSGSMTSPHPPPPLCHGGDEAQSSGSEQALLQGPDSLAPGHAQPLHSLPSQRGSASPRAPSPAHSPFPCRPMGPVGLWD